MLYILGVGNVLLKDDGVGVRVVEQLQTRTLPPGVVALDVGTAILRMLPELVKARRIVVVDAMRGGGEPGSIYYYEGAETRVASSRSVHDIQFDEVLAHLGLLGCAPEVEYYGVEPREIGFSDQLSPEVAAAVPLLANYLFDHVVTSVTGLDTETRLDG